MENPSVVSKSNRYPVQAVFCKHLLNMSKLTFARKPSQICKSGSIWAAVIRIFVYPLHTTKRGQTRIQWSVLTCASAFTLHRLRLTSTSLIRNLCWKWMAQHTFEIEFWSKISLESLLVKRSLSQSRTDF